MRAKRQWRSFFEEDGDAERKQDGFGEVDGRERGDLPVVVDGEEHEDGEVDVEEDLCTEIAEERDDADQRRDEDDDRHAGVDAVFARS